MKDLLGRLSEQHLNWALEGKDEYERGFLRLKKPEGEKRRVLIGVYGPTQVGKTTLILKLLGIKENRIIELSSALRGKRQMGNSATVTTSIYQRSRDENFVLIYPDGSTIVIDTLEQMEEAMSVVRQRVETQDYVFLKPLIIQISSCYFDMGELNSREQEIEILDLPGDDSKDKREMEHVVRCLKEYLSQCRLCILVEIADQMVSLTQINREYVRDWKVKPQSFRVVLTRAATSSSTMTAIREKRISTKDSFKAAIIDQLNEHLNENFNESGKRVKVYPLEYGDSWESLKSTYPVVYNSAKPWIDDIFKELYEDLCSVMSPESEILQSKLEVEFVEKASKEDLERLEKEILQLVKKRDRKQEDINRKETIIEQYKEQQGVIEQDRKFVSEIIELYNLEAVGITAWKKGDGSWIKRSSDITGNISFAADSINTYYKEQVESLNRSIKAIGTKYNLTVKAMEFEYEELAMQILGSTKIKKRYFIKKHFNKDLEKCEEALERYTSEFVQGIKGKLDKTKEDLIDKLDRVSESLVKNIKDYQGEIPSLEEEKKKENAGIADKEGSIERAKEEWEKDKETSKQFYLYLKKSFIKHAKVFQEKLLSSHTTSAEKWVYHQFWNRMRIDAERIIKND